MTRAQDNALPEGFLLGKSYEYGVDVNTGTALAPVWETVSLMSDFQLTPTPQTTDAQTYDDEGAPNSATTGWGWALAFATIIARSGTTGEYAPEIEALIRRTKPSAKGSQAQIGVRWYHQPDSASGAVPNPEDAGQGIATVSYSRANTGSDGAPERLSWTLTGVGAYTEIVNPLTTEGS
ncbi:phage tail tube protein [Litorihabitans aurantiacus]|uniref:Phage tail protein n=1 Tax=Litorihabitans aurantiacus TaxID=1930061 RepID=A0AA38CXE8_9MICO|nr:hypothetical protein [Litorihabitans aurantiacus]GMA33507.1 hypothetical protein GCM10025875_34990 [Litorihabitans aurantiacus]GMA33588.1 hypothetical protein GCM10025875_35800 [Litorihabitans aurantiacus]